MVSVNMSRYLRQPNINLMHNRSASKTNLKQTGNTLPLEDVYTYVYLPIYLSV